MFCKLPIAGDRPMKNEMDFNALFTEAPRQAAHLGLTSSSDLTNKNICRFFSHLTQMCKNMLLAWFIVKLSKRTKQIAQK